MGGVDQFPVASHVSTPLFTHCLLPTAQTPWQDAVLPLSTHVLFVHGESVVPHWPLPPQVCTALPEHCDVPGEHAPVHTPPLQVPAVQPEVAPHCPSLPHV